MQWPLTWRKRFVCRSPLLTSANPARRRCFISFYSTLPSSSGLNTKFTHRNCIVYLRVSEQSLKKSAPWLIMRAQHPIISQYSGQLRKLLNSIRSRKGMPVQRECLIKSFVFTRCMRRLLNRTADPVRRPFIGRVGSGLFSVTLWRSTLWIDIKVENNCSIIIKGEVGPCCSLHLFSTQPECCLAQYIIVTSPFPTDIILGSLLYQDILLIPSPIQYRAFTTILLITMSVVMG